VQIVAASRKLLDGEEEANEALRAAGDRLRERGVEFDLHVHATDPATALVHVAAERRARLVIVDAERQDAPRILPGDIPAAVARQAPCDVLIAR
jgi:nucleotide-binding universal stress UspA family protein